MMKCFVFDFLLGVSISCFERRCCAFIYFVLNGFGISGWSRWLCRDAAAIFWRDDVVQMKSSASRRL